MINQNLLHPFFCGMKKEKRKKIYVWTHRPPCHITAMSNIMCIIVTLIEISS